MEDVLDRHRSKLQEHRQFLQSYKTAAGEGQGGAQSAPTPDTTTLAMDSTQLTDQSADGAQSPAARAPVSTDTDTAPQNVPHAHMYLNTADANASPAHKTGSHVQPKRSDPAQKASENSKGLHDVDALLRSRGRYTSSQPADCMYVKSQAWLRRREWQTAAARRAQEDEERKACTFAPRLSSMEAANVYTDSEDGQWIGEAVEARRSRHRDTNEAGASASTSRSPSHKQASAAAIYPPQRQPTVGVLSDPAVVKHLSRLEAARQRREEAEKRVQGVDIEKWQNKTTKTRPFNLGVRPAEPIPSLRKPYIGGLEAAHYDPAAFMTTEDISVVDLLREQVRSRDLVIGDQEREILFLQQELREVKSMLEQLTVARKTDTLNIF